MARETQSYRTRDAVERRLLKALRLPQSRVRSVTLTAAAGRGIVATVEIVLTDAELEATFRVESEVD